MRVNAIYTLFNLFVLFCYNELFGKSVVIEVKNSFHSHTLWFFVVSCQLTDSVVKKSSHYLLSDLSKSKSRDKVFDKSQPRRNDPVLSFNEIPPFFLGNKFDWFRTCNVTIVSTNSISPKKGKQYEMKFLKNIPKKC